MEVREFTDQEKHDCAVFMQKELPLQSKDSYSLCALLWLYIKTHFYSWYISDVGLSEVEVIVFPELFEQLKEVAETTDSPAILRRQSKRGFIGWIWNRHDLTSRAEFCSELIKQFE